MPLSKTHKQAQEPRAPKKTFKRRRCENCNRLYTPIREDQRFCQHDGDNCRKEFHRYGSSYGPLKTGLHKAIDKKYAEMAKEATALGKTLCQRLERLAVEVAELRADIYAARGQFETHFHERGQIKFDEGVSVKERI